jgi:hypothetical protein
MLTAFDWLRRSRSGAELLSMLAMLSEDPSCFERLQLLAGFDKFGPAPYALAAPCARCGLYPRVPSSIFCPTCRVIRDGTRSSGQIVHDVLVVWGYVNQLPFRLLEAKPNANVEIVNSFIHDERHFLLLLRRRNLLPWLQELALYYGTDLRGHLQLMPTWGGKDGIGMGDLLCQMIRHENYYALDRLRLRFYMRHYQVLRPHEFDREGSLTYEIAKFVRLLEMAVIFRSILLPQEQKVLYDLLLNADENSDSFYWGRLMGFLSQRGRDLLDSWEVRRWKTRQVKYFYELTNYVDYYPAV